MTEDFGVHLLLLRKKEKRKRGKRKEGRRGEGRGELGRNKRIINKEGKEEKEGGGTTQDGG